MKQKDMFDKLLVACKSYINSIMAGYVSTDKEIASFEKLYMGHYVGNAPINHELFRKFLRLFDPDKIGGSSTLDQDIVTNTKCGGIEVGTQLSADTELNKIIIDMLFAYIKPSIAIALAGNEKVYEKGSTVNPTILYRATDSSSAKVIKIELLRGENIIQTHSEDDIVSGEQNAYEDFNITNDTTYKVKVYDDVKGDASDNTKQVSIVFKYKYFYGSSSKSIDDIVARELTSNFNYPSSFEMTGTKWLLYVPKNYPQPTTFKTLIEPYTIENETSTNADKKGVILKKQVTVPDADKNEVDYYRYFMQIDYPLNSDIFIEWQ